MIQPAAFATKSAKIRSVAAQRIEVAATRPFRIEGVAAKGRMIETHGESAAGTSREPSHLLLCKADQPILVSNSSYVATA